MRHCQGDELFCNRSRIGFSLQRSWHIYKKSCLSFFFFWMNECEYHISNEPMKQGQQSKPNQQKTATKNQCKISEFKPNIHKGISLFPSLYIVCIRKMPSKETFPTKIHLNHFQRHYASKFLQSFSRNYVATTIPLNQTQKHNICIHNDNRNCNK